MIFHNRMHLGSILGVMFLLMVFLFPAGPSIAQGTDDSDPDAENDYIQQIEQEYGLVEDPDVLARVGAIERRLKDVIPEVATDEREIIVKVLDDDLINAFALPDGHVYFFLGLIEACETDDMLAGVMAHELVHVYHRHHSRMGDRQLRGMLIGVAAMIATGDMEGLYLGQILSASMIETYGRSAENDADMTGALWTVQAGYDPVGFLELMEILEQQAIHRPEPGGNYFTVHPHPEERMANIRESLSELGIEVPQNIYRVHLPLRFYMPLTVEELAVLENFDEELERRAEGESSDSDETDDDVEEIPLSLLTEYQLRRELFSEISAPVSGVYGVVVVGDTGVFYLLEDTHSDLQARAENIITRLGGKFIDGLRSYDIQMRTLDGVPAVVADGRRVASVTELDALLLGLTPAEVNSERAGLLEDILYRYYIDRRI